MTYFVECIGIKKKKKTVNIFALKITATGAMYTWAERQRWRRAAVCLGGIFSGHFLGKTHASLFDINGALEQLKTCYLDDWMYD